MAVPATPPLAGTPDRHGVQVHHAKTLLLSQNSFRSLITIILLLHACLCQCHQNFFVGAVIIFFTTGEKTELFLYIRTHLGIRY